MTHLTEMNVGNGSHCLPRTPGKRHQRADEVVLVAFVGRGACHMNRDGDQLSDVVLLAYLRRKKLLHDWMVDVRRGDERLAAELRDN